MRWNMEDLPILVLTTSVAQWLVLSDWSDQDASDMFGRQPSDAISHCIWSKQSVPHSIWLNHIKSPYEIIINYLIIYIKAVWFYRAPSPTARRLCATQRVATLDGNLGYRHMCTEVHFFLKKQKHMRCIYQMITHTHTSMYIYLDMQIISIYKLYEHIIYVVRVCVFVVWFISLGQPYGQH